MKRRLVLMLAVCLVLPTFGATAAADSSVKAKVTTSTTYFDGEQGYVTGFNIAGNNYFSLRELAKNLSGTPSQFNIVWNQEQRAIEIVRDQAYSEAKLENNVYFPRNETYLATPSTSKLLIDGVPQSIKAFNIQGSTYFQLRDLSARVPFDLKYDSQYNQLSITSMLPEHAYRATASAKLGSNAVLPYFPFRKETVTSYLINNSDGSKSTIDAVNNKITIDTYNANYELTGSNSITYELPLFGGFYSGETYNYIAFGQENREENDNKEVIRIVRYDKSFKRIDSASVKGGESYTIVPFDAGSGRMAEHGDTLVFHTARKRYKTEDGLNHQSQLTLMVNLGTMKVTNDIGKFQKNHVSHSFDQYVQYDGSSQVLIDHGDAYPRSIVLQRGDGNSYSEVNLFQIPGKIGANATGVSIGGFEMSSSSYIVAMNTINHALVREYTSYEMVGLERDQRDVILSVLPKNTMSDAAVKHITLAQYIGSDNNASIPKLVKITDNQLLVLWQEFDKNNEAGDVKYIRIDGEGNAVGEIQTLKHFNLAESNPIVSGNNIVWYVNNEGGRMFYTIPLK